MRPTINILFLASIPSQKPAIDLNEEFLRIQDELSRSVNAERFRLFRHARLRRDELEVTLNSHQPHIVHFSGHGNSEGSLLLESSDGGIWELDRYALRSAIKADGNTVKLAILNSCHSEVAGNVLISAVPHVICNAIEVYDQAAIDFATNFYRELFRGETIFHAFSTARQIVGGCDAGRRKVPQLLDLPASPDPREVKPLVDWMYDSSVVPSPTESRSRQQVTMPTGMMEIKQLKGLAESNPGLSIKMEVSESHTALQFSVKPGFEGLTLGRLLFPVSTEAGRSGFQKFSGALDKGIAVELLPGECRFESGLSLPIDWLPPEHASVVITPTLQPSRNAVKLRATGKRLSGQIDIAYMSTVRSGLKEFEFSISGGRMAGEIRIQCERQLFTHLTGKNVSRRPVTIKCSCRIDRDWTKLNPEDALMTANLYLAAKEAEIKVTLLESKVSFALNVGVALPSNQELLFVRWVLTSLAHINRFFNVQLRCPVSLDDESRGKLFVLSQLADTGESLVDFESMATVTLDMSASAALVGLKPFIDNQNKSATIACWQDFYSLNFLGASIFIGPIYSELRDAIPLFDVKEAIEKITASAPDENIQISFQTKQIFHSRKKSRMPVYHGSKKSIQRQKMIG